MIWRFADKFRHEVLSVCGRAAIPGGVEPASSLIATYNDFDCFSKKTERFLICQKMLLEPGCYSSGCDEVCGWAVENTCKRGVNRLDTDCGESLMPLDQLLCAHAIAAQSCRQMAGELGSCRL